MDRYQLISQLLSEEDRINGEYISGAMERDTWAKAMENLDDRMAVLGIRLAFRPWESPANHKAPF